MQSLLKSLNIPNTLLLGGLSLIITHASAAGKPAHAWSVVETAKDNGHRLSAVPAPTKAAASAENAITYGPSFYYLARFSKFVQPGARRIHSDGGPQGIQSIAFSNPDGTLAIVVVNPTKQAAVFTLGVAGESVACTIPARAIQTYFEAPH